MSVNRQQPHVMIIPEDAANRQLAIGFALVCSTKQLGIENEVGGWVKLFDYFRKTYITTMRSFPGRHVVLLIDCDGDPNRINMILEAVPMEVKARTFVFGCREEPERLRAEGLGTFEKIGCRIARECEEGDGSIWNHDLLSHNVTERDRFIRAARHILWPK